VTYLMADKAGQQFLAAQISFSEEIKAEVLALFGVPKRLLSNDTVFDEFSSESLYQEGG